MGLIIQDIIIPESSSECSEWLVYFDKLSGKFGSDNARNIWLKTWTVNGSTSCTSNPTFLKFIQKHNIDVSNSATRAVADISQIGSNFLGLGKGITKALAIGVPAVMLSVVAIILYFLFKTAKSTDAKDLAALAPAGKALTA
jgi:hypothetical protein